MRIEIEDTKHVVIAVTENGVSVKATPLDDAAKLVSEVSDTFKRFNERKPVDAKEPADAKETVPYDRILTIISRLVQAAINGQSLAVDNEYKEDTWVNVSSDPDLWSLRIAPGGPTHQFFQMVYNLHATEASNRSIRDRSNAATINIDQESKSKHVPFDLFAPQLESIVRAAVKGLPLDTDSTTEEDAWDKITDGRYMVRKIATDGPVHNFYKKMRAEFSRRSVVNLTAEPIVVSENYRNDILTGVFCGMRQIIDQVEHNKGLVINNTIKEDDYSNHNGIIISSNGHLVHLYHRLVRFRAAMVKQGMDLEADRTGLCDKLDEVSSILNEIAPDNPAIAQPIDMHREVPSEHKPDEVDEVDEVISELTKTGNVAPINTTGIVVDPIVDTVEKKPMPILERKAPVSAGDYMNTLLPFRKDVIDPTVDYSGIEIFNGERTDRFGFLYRMVNGDKYAPITKEEYHAALNARHGVITSANLIVDPFHTLFWFPAEKVDVILRIIAAEKKLSDEEDALQASAVQYYDVLANHLLTPLLALNQEQADKNVKNRLEFIKNMLKTNYLPVKPVDLNNARTENIAEIGVVCNDPFHMAIWIGDRAARKINKHYQSELLLD